MAPVSSRSRPAPPPPPAQTLVLDTGAYTMKAGFSSPSTDPSFPNAPRIIPNCLARDGDKKVYIGSDLSKCKDFSEIVFRRPVEKGYLVNWEAEKEIWEHEFLDGKAKLHCDPTETGLVLTEAPNALPVLQTNCDQMVFEEFGFARYLRTPGPVLNAYNDIQSIFKAPPRDPTSTPLPAEILMLIDSSYSHTTITPLLMGRPINPSIRRLDVGGKLMTNYLTRLLSLRQWDMRNETYLVNEIKEATSYISLDFKGDLEKTWKGSKGDPRPGFETAGGIAKDYVLPDYHDLKHGFVRDHDPMAGKKLREAAMGKAPLSTEQVMVVRSERFTVPELLFTPTDIGLRQSGIPQQILDSLSSIPQGLWPGFLANIVVVGGNANIPGFVERLQMEMRSLAPAECIVRVGKGDDPVVSTWYGGANLARNEERLAEVSVTKQEYEEFGAGWVARKFGGK